MKKDRSDDIAAYLVGRALPDIASIAYVLVGHSPTYFLTGALRCDILAKRKRDSTASR
jgi:hypothetical protein